MFFGFSERRTPIQLQETLSKGAKFNVKRSISDFGEDDDFDTNGWLFEYGETPLHRAAAYNHNPESIKFLIAQGLDVNAGGSTGKRISGSLLASVMTTVFLQVHYLKSANIRGNVAKLILC